MHLERRKITSTSVVEIYAYQHSQSKEEFFNHLKTMRARGYKNKRDDDRHDEKYFYATYEKVVLKTK